MKTVNHGFENLEYLAPKIWKTIPSHLKKTDFLKNFKNTMKNGNRVNVRSTKYTKYIFKT